MNEPDKPEVPMAPEYEVWTAQRQRMAEGQERGRKARAALSAEVKAANARLEAIGSALSDATRWRILLELGKGDALPVAELAKRTDRPPAAISRHMALMLKAGLVERVFSTCYTLPAALRPAPGATTIDLGPCLLKLPAPR
jgi:DNA-binding transcriptional ArsR family regulator